MNFTMLFRLSKDERKIIDCRLCTKQDVDIGDDRPIPSHKDGVKGYDIFLDKLRHPRAAEVVKTLQQFVAAFKARAEGVTKQLSSPGPR